MNLSDTIAAISTPIGEGGISVIRISGTDAFHIVEKIFYKDVNAKKGFLLEEQQSHTIHFGYIIYDSKLVDEVLLSIFKAPNSFTGENVIEISSHGGSFISQKILSIFLGIGARHANPGEFTERAFLNGRMDLSQAEAVSDLIRSRTDAAHNSSIKQLEGSLSDLVNKTRQDIINIISLVELELDFAEEGLEFVKKEEIKSKIVELNSKLEKIIASYITGKVIREGVNLVIAGKPNSGKSSLFNYFLKNNRSIVSDIAGTTRDYIEESIIINGILFNLIDTAGLRSSGDVIESEGIKRSHKKIEEADLVIYLSDSSQNETQMIADLEYFKKNFDGSNSIFVFSKSDIAAETTSSDNLRISILKDDTIDALKSAMVSKVTSSQVKLSSDDIILTNLRHRICLENVVVSLKEAVKTIDAGMTGEFISVDLRNAISHLGEITGEVTNDTILENIFRNFCIGK